MGVSVGVSVTGGIAVGEGDGFASVTVSSSLGAQWAFVGCGSSPRLNQPRTKRKLYAPSAEIAVLTSMGTSVPAFTGPRRAISDPRGGAFCQVTVVSLQTALVSVTTPPLGTPPSHEAIRAPESPFPDRCLTR